MMNTKNNDLVIDKSIHRFDTDDVKVHSVNTCFQGFFQMQEYQLSHRLFNGEYSDIITRELFERGDAVVLMPYDAKLDKVILLEQFRPGALQTGDSPWLLEFVAGMFNHDEVAEDVAIREAKEEANIDIKSKDLIKIMSYLSSPGGMSEQIHLYMASIDSTLVNEEHCVHGLIDEGEDILVHVMSRTQALALLAQGKINNAATVIGLQWLALNYQSLQNKLLQGSD